MKLNYLLIVVVITLTYGCTTKASTTPPAANSPTLASPVSATNRQNIKSGTFVAGEHDTVGNARIYQENGKNYLELDENFTTSNLGPDLYVVLHRSNNVLASTSPPAYSIKEADYVIVNRLQKYSGSQCYLIPENIKLENYQSAVIWCRLFNATFGTAKLGK